MRIAREKTMLSSIERNRTVNNERTLDLQEASLFLRISSETLRDKAKAGIIKGAKPGKCWVFLESDLVEYLRSLYPVSTGQVPSSGCEHKEVSLCHSTNAVKSGGYGSLVQVDGEYEDLLELDARSKPKSSMTG